MVREDWLETLKRSKTLHNWLLSAMTLSTMSRIPTRYVKCCEVVLRVKQGWCGLWGSGRSFCWIVLDCRGMWKRWRVGDG